MNSQTLQILDCLLGMVIGFGGWYSGSGAGRWGYGLVPVCAAVLFFLLLLGMVHL